MFMLFTSVSYLLKMKTMMKLNDLHPPINSFASFVSKNSTAKLKPKALVTQAMIKIMTTNCFSFDEPVLQLWTSSFSSCS